MKCENCGAEINQDSIFCEHCGAKIEPKPVTPPVYQQPVRQPQSISSAATPAKSHTGIMVAVALVLVVTLIAGGGFAIYKKLTKQTEEANRAVQDSLAESVEALLAERYESMEAALPQEGLDMKQETEALPMESETALRKTEVKLPDSAAQVSEYSESDYIFPDSSTRYLSPDEVQAVARQDKSLLRIARNEIYARHGRIFQDEGLNTYFTSKSWYSGTIMPDQFDEKMLNQYEKTNRDLIKTYE